MKERDHKEDLDVDRMIMLIRKLVENSNSYNLYTRAECHVVSKAFSIFKNTAAVDILLKFRMT
jgi:hypothetical protein